MNVVGDDEEEEEVVVFICNLLERVRIRTGLLMRIGDSREVL